MIYDSQMDKQCVILCDAINNIPGLFTTESCCGHDKYPLEVWFHADTVQNLYVLVKSVNRMYGGPTSEFFEDWKITVYHNDLEEIVFRLQSSTIGNTAYEQANQLANNIQYHLSHEQIKNNRLATYNAYA